MSCCPCRQCQGLGPREHSAPEAGEVLCKYCDSPMLDIEAHELYFEPADDEGPAYWTGWHLACVKQKGVSK